jgi:hypothetical protein
VACPTLRSGQPTGWPERPDSNSPTGITAGGRPLQVEGSAGTAIAGHQATACRRMGRAAGIALKLRAMISAPGP